MTNLETKSVPFLESRVCAVRTSAGFTECFVITSGVKEKEPVTQEANLKQFAASLTMFFSDVQSLDHDNKANLQFYTIELNAQLSQI